MQSNTPTHAVIVTFGTVPNQVYAEAFDMPSARMLQGGARERGYRDAKIVDWKRFQHSQEAQRRRQASPRHAA